MVMPQDPPPYSRRSNNTYNPHHLSASSSNFFSGNHATTRSGGTFASVAASAAAFVTGGGGGGRRPGDHNGGRFTPSRHYRSLSNSSNQSDLPSAMVDKHPIYYPGTNGRSFRRRFLSRKAMTYCAILAVIALCSCLYLQPSVFSWRSHPSSSSPSHSSSSSSSVDHHHHAKSNHDREGDGYHNKYDYDYPLDRDRQLAQERDRAYERERQRELAIEREKEQFQKQQQERQRWKKQQTTKPGDVHDEDRNGGLSHMDPEDSIDSDGMIDHGSNNHHPNVGGDDGSHQPQDQQSNPNFEESSHRVKSGQTPLDPESIVLYRILGNDLPPRHRPGQTLSNVRFILEHEPEFGKTTKVWVLNRIVDPLAEHAIIQLLEHHRQEYIRIPFRESEYLKQDYRLEDFPQPDFFSSEDYAAFSKVAKLRVLDYTYHDKNNYAMNNNGGRNIAIQHGKTQMDARWVFAFDGNSFLTNNAMAEIKEAIREHGERVRYFVVPMARLIDNTQLLKGMDDRPNSKEEPQIIFRNDAPETYNPDMRYGRRSKLELLWRLGALERSKLSKPSVSWELSEREPLANKDDFKVVGWVFRLFSGKRSQEENTRQSAAIRAYNRLLAIQDLIDGVDERIARRGFGSQKLLIYKDSVLQANRQQYWIGQPGAARMVVELQSKGCEILGRRAGLLKKTSAEDLIIYPADNQGQPMVPPILAKVDGANAITLQSMYDEVTTLTMAHYFTGNETFARAAANIVRSTLLQEHDQRILSSSNHHAMTAADENTEYLLDQGYSFPALNRLPRLIPKTNGAWNARPMLTIPKDLLTADTLPAFLDGIRMLHRVHMLTQNEFIQLKLVFSAWLEHMVNSPEGVQYAKQGDHRSTFMDLHVAALAAITDDVRLFLRVVNRARMRIGRQFMVVQDGKIKMPYEQAFAQRQSMAGLLQPGGAAADVTGQELAGMYIDEETDEIDLSLDHSRTQSSSFTRGLDSLMKDSMMSSSASQQQQQRATKSGQNPNNQRFAHKNNNNGGIFGDRNKDAFDDGEVDMDGEVRVSVEDRNELDDDHIEYGSQLDTASGSLGHGDGSDSSTSDDSSKGSSSSSSSDQAEGGNSNNNINNNGNNQAFASSTPQMVNDGAEPVLSVPELTEKYSALNLQYWTLLTRMIHNANMASAPDVWRHRTKRGYHLGDVVRNYVRQDHYRSSGGSVSSSSSSSSSSSTSSSSAGLHRATLQALLYTARKGHDHIPARLFYVNNVDAHEHSVEEGSPLAKVQEHLNDEMLNWDDLGLDSDVFEKLEMPKESLGGSLPGTGVPPFWMLGVIEQ
ncbi:hypothetical protein DFQ26_008796 [Actinomortierella ambigua]|nr:hypothetical protein DFQ26_008796 [Actinomortierella ambigua]